MVTQKQYAALLDRFASESDTTVEVLMQFTDQALKSANIRISTLSIEQITKILASLVGSLELAVDIADGKYEFQVEEIDIIRSIADECRGAGSDGKNTNKG